MKPIAFYISTLALLSSTCILAEPKITLEHFSNEESSADFHFKKVPPPARHDLAEHARISILEGTPDANSGGLGKLNDSELPSSEDQPGANFFFEAGSRHGRIVFDLGKKAEVQ
jgi:hypothetical protein